MNLNEEIWDQYRLRVRDAGAGRAVLEGENGPDFETVQYFRVLLGKNVEFRKTTAPRNPVKTGEKSFQDSVELLNRSFDGSRENIDMENIEDLVNREPVIRFVNLLFGDAIQKNASDIHIEVYEEKIHIRVRIDGVLQDYPAPNKAFYNAIVSRIKLLGGMDIAQRRLPQDGRYNIENKEEAVDFRISTVPTLYGESVVIRILNKKKGLIRIGDLGWNVKRIREVKDILSMHQGMVLVTGPTGSGKSTTLYAFLQELNDGSSKIITIEDPVEYQIEGINQIHVNPEIDLTFASGLRSVLRQDPDIIMVGEIRDQETARIAVQASLTGHLVLSTLHTNDSISAVNRLTDLGAENSLLGPALKIIIAQRLVRKICPKCRAVYKPDKKKAALLGLSRKKKFYSGKGCKNCGGTGYRGRIALFEVLRVNGDVQDAILNRKSPREIEKLAMKDGFITLREDAAGKIAGDLTTVEEVARVIEL